MRSDTEVRRAADTYQFGLLRVPASGRAGELLGRGTGSSLEFQEYREYTPGDDIRHLDWAAYGRSDTLMVRLYREEISPRTEILLDTSLSMAVAAAKPLLANLKLAEAEQGKRLEELAQLLAGGDVGRGRKVFFGQKAICGTCHTIGKAGIAAGDGCDIVRVSVDFLDLARPEIGKVKVIPLCRQADRIHELRDRTCAVGITLCASRYGCDFCGIQVDSSDTEIGNVGNVQRIVDNRHPQRFIELSISARAVN